MPSTNSNQIALEWKNLSADELSLLVDRCYDWLESFANQCRERFKIDSCLTSLIRNNKDLPGRSFWEKKETPISTEKLAHVILLNLRVNRTDALFLQLYSFQLLAKLLASDASKMKSPVLNHMTRHRLFVTLLLCACKVNSESYCNNGKMSAVSGLSLEEVNQQERELMNLLDWNLFPTISPYQTLEILNDLPCPSWEEMIFSKEENDEVKTLKFRTFFELKNSEDSPSPFVRAFTTSSDDTYEEDYENRAYLP